MGTTTLHGESGNLHFFFLIFLITQALETENSWTAMEQRWYNSTNRKVRIEHLRDKTQVFMAFLFPKFYDYDSSAVLCRLRDGLGAQEMVMGTWRYQACRDSTEKK